MSKKSNKHLEYLDFIREYWRVNRCSPSMREIADHFHTGTSVVSYYVDRLRELGKLLPASTDRASRQIVPVDIANAIDAAFEDRKT